MNTISIENLQPSDTDEIHSMVSGLAPLTHHTWYSYWTEFMSFGNSCFKAQDLETKLIAGFITSHPILTTPQLEWFCWQIGVREEYRRQGIGVELLGRAVDTALAAGATAMRFTIEPDNVASLATFQRVANSRNYKINTLDELETPSGTEVLYQMSYSTQTDGQ